MDHALRPNLSAYKVRVLAQALEFEVVLADGRIVNANVDENGELWEALKGSSGNLGFVTRFDMREYC